MFLSKYGVARHIYIPIVKRAVVDFAVGADWTPAAGDVKISKDGGAAANVTNLPVAIVMGNGALWDFSLTATEMQAAQIVVTIADSATKAVEDQAFIIETHGNASALFQVDLADGVRAGLTALPNAAAAAIGGLLTAPTTANVGLADLSRILGTALTETAGLLAGGFKKFFNVAAPVATMDHGVLVDTVTTYTGNTPQTGDNFARTGAPAGASVSADIAAVKAVLPGALVGGKIDANVGSVTAGAIAAASFAANALDAVWSTATRILTAGTNIVLAKGVGVTGFTDLDAAAVRTAVGLASANVDTQLSAIKSEVDTILADVNVGAGAIYTRLGAPAGASIAADIAAVKAVDDAIKAKTDNLPASPAAVGSAMTLTAAYDFAKGTVAMTESYAANGVAPTPIQILYAIHQGEYAMTITGTTMAVKKLDGSTTAFSATLDSSTAPTAVSRP